jgi:tRNA threonylcarbamoyladenosine modification (KEOPS) complex  Pcc1 subunit
MSPPEEWTATLTVRRREPAAAARLYAALLPEAAREVPRARARVEHPSPNEVRIALTARDTGALRAAFNTYLGWIALADRTEVAGRTTPAGSSGSAPGTR